VKVVQRGPIEAGYAITGDLKPIEAVSIRSRIEGDLTSVLVREGDRVQVGQMLAQFEAAEHEGNYGSAEAEKAAAQSELQTAQWNADQSMDLFKAGALAERDLRSAQQAVVTAKARLAAAEARLRSASVMLQGTRVIAPTSGTIDQRLVENGEHVARGAPMFSLVRNDVLELAANVPARQAEGIRPSQHVRFSAAGRDLEGRVARVSPTINPANRSITVWVQVPNPDGAIKGNTLATGRIIGRTIPDALVVPTAALRQSPEDGKPYVYRIAGSALEHASVVLGIVDESGGVAEVTSGLSVGDRIVVGNVGTLGNGMKVQIMTGETQDRGGRGERRGATR
jgi:RND family efflux transporter MFP subunit